MKPVLISRFLLVLVIAAVVPEAFPLAGDDSPPRPELEILDCRVEATLIPDTHEIEATAAITLVPQERTDQVVFDLSENLYVQRVLDEAGIEQHFEQGTLGPGILSVTFSEPLETGSKQTIRVEYKGGFDRDRYSRMYSADESSAYIGEEGSYLMYGAKWIPVNRFLKDRATTTIEVTVPLGMTVIGPGNLQPVITRGINEIFTWTTDVPILPGSIVVGRYYQREVQAGEITLDCFTYAEDTGAMQKMAQTVAEIVAYYRDAYGPAVSGARFRLVEVDDKLIRHPGMLGTVFVTGHELEQTAVPVRELARRVAYQWWRETVGVQGTADLWLEDGMAYYSAAEYMGKKLGEGALKDELDALAILALKFENTAAVRNGFELGYRTDRYESVVAGKGAWVLNMLHGLLGDSKFKELVQRYIRDYKGRGGSTAGFQALAESQYGKPLDWFFNEWVDTTGIPSLQSDYVIYKTADGFRVSGAVKQDRDLFRMPLEIAVVGKDEQETVTVDLTGITTPFDINTFTKPDKIVIDPNNRLLRDSPELQSSVQFALGNDRKAEGDFIGAIRAYESALKKSPQRSLVHFRMAEVYYEQFNLQSAADYFRSALNGDLNPKWVEVWSYIYLGKIYDILGQRQRAMAEYTKAVNTKDDTDGAQAEAKKWLQTPFTRKRTVVGE